MAVELTRFDFHVNKFLNSEDVENMTDAEVGQYLLLLCKSFVLGKGATLPDEPNYLAKTARCTKVSALVLKKFPLVETEWGPRRRNETMYGEWLAAVERSASASERGKKGSDSRWGKEGGNSDSPGYSNSSAVVIANNHTNSIIPIISTQSNQDSFKTIRTHWYRYFTKNLSTSKRNRDQYAEACSTYSEDRVLAYLEKWAAANSWVAAHPKGENRLYVFLAALPAMVDGDQMRSSSENGQHSAKKVTESLIEAAIAASREESSRRREELEKKWSEDDKNSELAKGVMF